MYHILFRRKSNDADYRYVVLFYKTEHFTGELQSSDEGKVWWENFENLSHLKLATEDMSDMLRVFLGTSVNSFTTRMGRTGLTNSNNSKSAEVTPPILSYLIFKLGLCPPTNTQ